MSEIYQRHLAMQTVALSGLMSGTDSLEERADILAAYRDAAAAFEPPAANDVGGRAVVIAPQQKKKKPTNPIPDAASVPDERSDGVVAT